MNPSPALGRNRRRTTKDTNHTKKRSFAALLFFLFLGSVWFVFFVVIIVRIRVIREIRGRLHLVAAEGRAGSLRPAIAVTGTNSH